ncbi:TPA: dATP/dGTP pyrophosphohydrolase domain-containing protein [Salmonella enterica]
MLNIIGLLEKNEWAEHCTNTVLGSLLESEITRLVSKEQQAPERERIRRKHAEWSDKTFGDVGPVGPLKHLSKEALEAAADPSDPLEWADMQFLLWDAQRRMGISDEFITRAMIEKLEINKTRQWPEPKDGEPRLHIKEQPESVVPEECPAELPYAQVKAVADLYALCWQSGEVVTYTPDPEKATIWLNNYSGTCVQEYVKLERLQEALAGNSPVIPGGWISCSERMPDEIGRYWCYVEEQNDLGKSHYQWNCSWNGDKWGGEMMSGKVTHWMPLPEPPQEFNRG